MIHVVKELDFQIFQMQFEGEEILGQNLTKGSQFLFGVAVENKRDVNGQLLHHLPLFSLRREEYKRYR